MSKKRSTRGRRRKKYRIKKRFFVFLLILGLCLFGMVKCSVRLLSGEIGLPFGESAEYPDDEIRRTAIESTEEWKLILVNKTHKLPLDHTV